MGFATSVVPKDGTLVGTTTHEDTSTAKGSSGAVNPEVCKDELVEAALDKLKESKKSDDEGKGTTNGCESREEPEAKMASDTKTEIGGERMKERERDRARERTRGRDYDREREDYERGRDNVKERVHSSRDRGKDSGPMEKSKHHSSRERDHHSSSYSTKEKDRCKHHYA